MDHEAESDLALNHSQPVLKAPKGKGAYHLPPDYSSLSPMKRQGDEGEGLKVSMRS